MSFGPLLTPWEYDNLLDDATKQALANVVQQPMFDNKSHAYRHQFGGYRNGNLDSDPRVMSITGYGEGNTNSGKVPLPITPVYADDLIQDETSASLTSDVTGNGV